MLLTIANDCGGQYIKQKHTVNHPLACINRTFRWMARAGCLLLWSVRKHNRLGLQKQESLSCWSSDCTLTTGETAFTPTAVPVFLENESTWLCEIRFVVQMWMSNTCQTHFFFLLTYDKADYLLNQCPVACCVCKFHKMWRCCDV